MLSLLTLLACSSAPTITGVDPLTAHPGDAIQLVGTRFAEGAEGFLQAGEGAPPTAVELTTVRAPVLVELVLPKGTEPGSYRVGLKQGGYVATFPGELVVEPVPVDRPCTGAYKINTLVSTARSEVVIDRFYRDGERETVRKDLKEVERVEVEGSVLDDGGSCSAIFLVSGDGQRLLFADDRTVDLKDQAYKLGQTMGKRVEVRGTPPAPPAP